MRALLPQKFMVHDIYALLRNGDVCMKYPRVMVLVAAVTVAWSGAALAGPQWSYIQGEFGLVEAINTDTTNTNYGIVGSVGFANIVHIGARYNKENIETRTGMTTQKEKNEFVKAWIGLHPHLTDNTDLYFEIGAGQINLDMPTCTLSIPPICQSDPSLYDVTAGIRSMLTDKFELNARFTYGDIDDFGADYVWSFGGRYLFTPKFSIGATFTAEQPTYLQGGRETLNSGVIDFRLGFD